MAVEFFVPGQPVGKGRPRAAVEKAGKWPARLPRWGDESGPTGTTA